MQRAQQNHKVGQRLKWTKTKECASFMFNVKSVYLGQKLIGLKRELWFWVEIYLIIDFDR